MESMNDLRALLEHEVQDLTSAEDQIIEALPAMIEKATDKRLKQALQQHLKVTEQQRALLDLVMDSLQDGNESSSGGGLMDSIKKLFGGGQKCKGMDGIITEGQKMMSADMSTTVMDAAIIASAQKVEHYEICGYGTARSYAKQLGLREVERLLEQTLNEEYEADDLLTSIAEGDLNRRAEKGGAKGSRTTASKSSSSNSKSSSSRSTGTSSRSATGSRTSSSKSVGGSGRSSAGSKSSSAKSSSSGSKSTGGKTTAKRSTGKKAATAGRK